MSRMIGHMKGAGYSMIGWMKIPIYRGVCNDWVVDSPSRMIDSWSYVSNLIYRG